MPVNDNNIHVIRPAGRHLLTIGRDLIQDPSAAIVELVKNSYDADSPYVKVSIQAQDDASIVIIVKDSGHGMSRETVLGAWLVPSTSDKLRRLKSPKGRILQGRKGVGRFASSVLGDKLDLETVTEDGERTLIHMDWRAFEKADYLDQVHIHIETDNATSSMGTLMIMSGREEFRSEWTDKQFSKLKRELKKLVVPTANMVSDLHRTKDDFTIFLKIEGFGEAIDWSGVVEPFPIFELYDYRICGSIEADGKGDLVYHQKKLVRNSVDEKIPFNLKSPTGCGCIEVDIRVFDREPTSLTELIRRGLKHDDGNYVGKLEAQRILNESCGIGVYRNGFRIRPLGDPDFDWLTLNQKRVQNPSMCIGSNQVIGYVRIQSEEESGLIEKSARDGLKENGAFESLKSVTRQIISNLEAKRFDFRKQAGLSRNVVRVEETLEKFFTLKEVRKRVKKSLEDHKASSETVNAVMLVIDDAEQTRAQQAEDIQREFSIYQAHVALGKLINVILHEARRPLSFFRNNAKTIDGWHRLYLKDKNVEVIEEQILPIIELFPKECGKMTGLFARLDPLASDRRDKRKNFSPIQQINRILALFKHEADKDGVTFVLVGNELSQMYGWIQDIDAIFSNLLDNSLYWMKGNQSHSKQVIIEQVTDDNGKLLYIDYRDTGVGIDEKLLKNESIFDPGFSMKPDGHGLGLAIAGEAARRLGFILKALEHDGGAWFRMEPIEITT